MIIINADDWGRNRTSTNNSLICFSKGRITSASAMVFMEDSERAAELALEYNIDVGLHLNFTHKFDGNLNSNKLIECQQHISSFLRRSKYCSLLYNPLLKRDFEYSYNAQYEDFVRLYNKEPTHIDGHHHMHLCSNMLFSKLIPKCSKVRRSFSFATGEKSMINRLYRSFVNRWLKRRHKCTDFFFSIASIRGSDRLRRIVELSLTHSVELMVHPENPDEYDYVLSAEFLQMIKGIKRDSYAVL
jgi:predicted glycoside hydrolase/deacetylase ChbG (UPF0249 family)